MVKPVSDHRPAASEPQNGGSNAHHHERSPQKGSGQEKGSGQGARAAGGGGEREREHSESPPETEEERRARVAAWLETPRQPSRPPLAEVERRWYRLAHDPAYRGLPGILETNAVGQVIMEPPPENRHRLYQRAIVRLLETELDGGLAVHEQGIHTPEGTKVPDVIWAPVSYWKHGPDQYGRRKPPPLCVEVRSAFNTDAEITMKKDLYLRVGVDEVWVCTVDGTLHFHSADGEMDTSQRVPNAPSQIDNDRLYT